MRAGGQPPAKPQKSERVWRICGVGLLVCIAGFGRQRNIERWPDRRVWRHRFWFGTGYSPGWPGQLGDRIIHRNHDCRGRDDHSLALRCRPRAFAISAIRDRGIARCNFNSAADPVDTGWQGTGAATYAQLLPIYREFGSSVTKAPSTASAFAIELGWPMTLFTLQQQPGLSSMLYRGALDPRARFILSGCGHGLCRHHSLSGLLRYQPAEFLRRRGRRRRDWTRVGAKRQ